MRDKRTGKILDQEEIKQLIFLHPKFRMICDNLISNASKKTLTATLDMKEDWYYRYEKLINNRYYDIDALDINFDASIKSIKVPVKLKRKYSRRTEDPDKSIIFAQISEYEGVLLGKPIIFRAFNFPTIHKSKVECYYDNSDIQIYDSKLTIEYKEKDNIPKTMQFSPNSSDNSQR